MATTTDSAMAPESLTASLAVEFPKADPATTRIVRAPGRVNLIGDHTDYNEGFVLPMAIGLELRIAFTRTADRHVELVRLDTRERAAFDLDDIGPPIGGWIDYVAGVARELISAGATLGGLRGVLAASLPIGAGLSSSAALELAAAYALLEPADPGSHGFDLLDIAQIAQRAENGYVGVRCGIMDQLAVAVAEHGTALLLDCRNLQRRSVALTLDGCALVAIQSGMTRDLGSSAYNARRAECERAATAIRRRHPHVSSLRDVDTSLLGEARTYLDPIAFRRVQHVVGENRRVLAVVTALEAGDLESVGRLFDESHSSLRDLYEVSSPALDRLVEVAKAVDGVLGARMTGAGFGGSTINLVRRDSLKALRAAIQDRRAATATLMPVVDVVEPVDGAGPLAGTGPT